MNSGFYLHESLIFFSVHSMCSRIYSRDLLRQARDTLAEETQSL